MSAGREERRTAPAAGTERARGGRVQRSRAAAESALIRLVATVGIVAVGVALGAVLVGQDVKGWIVGLVVSLVSVVLAGLAWFARPG
jgi:hypothetical protein